MSGSKQHREPEFGESEPVESFRVDHGGGGFLPQEKGNLVEGRGGGVEVVGVEAARAHLVSEVVKQPLGTAEQNRQSGVVSAHNAMA